MPNPLLRLIKHIREMAPPAILSVMHRRHEDTRTTRLSRALSPQTLNLAITIDLVVLEHSQLRLLALMLDLLRCGVDLLLALLGTATKTEDEMQCALLLDVVVGERAAVFELLAGEDEALLVGWDALLVCDDVSMMLVCVQVMWATDLESSTSHCRWYRTTPPQG